MVLNGLFTGKGGAADYLCLIKDNMCWWSHKTTDLRSAVYSHEHGQWSLTSDKSSSKPVNLALPIEFILGGSDGGVS